MTGTLPYALGRRAEGEALGVVALAALAVAEVAEHHVAPVLAHEAHVLLVARTAARVVLAPVEIPDVGHVQVLRRQREAAGRPARGRAAVRCRGGAAAAGRGARGSTAVEGRRGAAATLVRLLGRNLHLRLALALVVPPVAPPARPPPVAAAAAAAPA